MYFFFTFKVFLDSLREIFKAINANKIIIINNPLRTEYQLIFITQGPGFLFYNRPWARYHIFTQIFIRNHWSRIILYLKQIPIQLKLYKCAFKLINCSLSMLLLTFDNYNFSANRNDRCSESKRILKINK